MGIDLRNGYHELRRHIGHTIACVSYGSANVALECEDCDEVLLDFDSSPEKGANDSLATPDILRLARERLEAELPANPNLALTIDHLESALLELEGRTE